MTITIGLWVIPAVLSVILWMAVFLWPIDDSGGDYNFGPALDAILHAAVGVIGTLVIWLAYFMALAVFG